MKLVRPRLGRDVDLCNGPAVFGVEQPRLDFELADGVERQQHVAVEIQVGVLDPVERVVVEMDALPRDVQREAVALSAHPLLALSGPGPLVVAPGMSEVSWR